LVIACKDGRTITYARGFFNRLLESKPEYVDLTERFILEFSGGVELEETKARLLMCGGVFDFLLNGDTEEHQNHRVSLLKIPQQVFQEVLHAVEDEVTDISKFSEGVRLAMDFLMFSPLFPAGVHGKKDWNARGVDVDEVPPLPQELLRELNESCPIAQDGSKKIDTHVILWMPPTLNGELITIDSLEKVAMAEAFATTNIGYAHCYDSIRNNAVMNQPLERGYWLALYKKPIAGGLHFEEKKQYLSNHCPCYEVPKIREVIACSLMQYGCSGEQQEFILFRGDEVSYSICEEAENGAHVVVGALSYAGIRMFSSVFDDSLNVGVCPVKRFYP
jgi:hypothetical protein